MHPRRRATGLLSLALAVGVVALAPISPASAAPSLTVLGPLVTLKSGDATPAGSASAVLTTARNEFESFQVAVSTDAAPISTLAVDLAGDLVGTGGGVLGADSFTVYRESYYTVGSDHLSDGESSTGGWPDALVPQVDPIYHQARSAFSAAVPASSRVVLWVDVLAGQNQTPDTYTGTLRVKNGATVVGTVPLSVTVRNIDLPSTSSLDSVFLTEPVNQCVAHTGSGSCNNDPVEANRLSAVYERMALENRITISTPWQVDRDQNLSGAMQTNWRNLVKPIVNGTAAPAADGSPIRLPDARATGLVVWHHCLSACLDGWNAEAAASGFADRLRYYTCDEPNQSAGNWTACQNNHAVAQAKGLRELVTTPLSYAHNSGAAAESWIDDMVVLERFMAGKSGEFLGNQRPSYDTWAAASGDGQANKVWIYSSCEAAGCNGPPEAGWNASTYDGWGGYGIDQPSSQARAMSWLAFLYDATGELYWGLDYRLSQAWNACGAGGSNCLYESGMNGDATLFYPGKACAPGSGPGCIGGTTDIPIESIRLKRIRDGREDYEYLKRAVDNPDTAALARSTALTLFGGSLDSATFSATFSQSELDTARDTLGDALEQPYVPQPAALSIGDASVGEGTGTDQIMTFTVSGTGDGYGYADVRTVPGTADDADYALLDSSVEMGSHETRQVRVQITGDALREATETFTVELWNNTGIALADSSGVGTIVDNDSPVARYRPDAEIRRGTRAYRGNDVYNSTGAGQTIMVKARRGVTRTFYVRVRNDGNVADNWSFAEARGGTRRFRRTWTYGSQAVTTEVAAGTLSLRGVPVGATRLFKVTVKPRKRARIGQVGTWSLHAVHNPLADRIRDVVRLQVRVIR
jgi:hypothetical protein